MPRSKKTTLEGISFGVSNAIIGILGVLIGLAATGVRPFVEIGVIIFGVCNSMADAASMYISEESEYSHSKKELIKISLETFVAEFLTLILIALPLFIFELNVAIFVSFGIGVVLFLILGHFVADGDKKLKLKHVFPRYLFLIIIVAIVSYFVGLFAVRFFSGAI